MCSGTTNSLYLTTSGGVWSGRTNPLYLTTSGCVWSGRTNPLIYLALVGVCGVGELTL